VTSINHSQQQIGHSDKKNPQSSELNVSVGQMDLTAIYRIFYSITSEYTFFSAASRTCSKIDYILGHKASLNK
jgi:hypothetical protein